MTTMREGGIYPAGWLGFAAGRIVNVNSDAVEHFVLIRYWPKRRLFIAKSVSGLYSMERAFTYRKGGLWINLQLHVRWRWLRGY